MTIIKKWWWLILALLIRVPLLFLDYSFDLNNHIIWATDALNNGLSGYYQTQSSEIYATMYPNYPPLSIWLFTLVYYVWLGLFKILWWINLQIPAFPSFLVLWVESRGFLAGLLKIPSLIFDFGLAGIVYLTVKKISPQKPKQWFMAAGLILFNPAIIYISSFWGQIDIIPITMSLIAFYLALFTKKPQLSLVIFTLGLLIKPTTLVYLPIYGYLLYQRFPLQKILAGLFWSNLVFWLSFLPFFQHGNLALFPYQIFVNRILTTQSIQNINNSALNAWLLIPNATQLKDLTPAVFNLSFRQVGYILTAIAYLSIFLLYRRWPKKPLSFFLAQFLTSLAAFLFLTRMHERYILLSLPFLVIITVIRKRFLFCYWLFSGIAFLNIYKSFAIPKVEFIMNGFSQGYLQIIFSCLTVMVMFIIWKMYYQETKINSQSERR